ncbi:MAG: FecR domain-containing protein [Bacteroides sp.]|nr:FecR domain-containing protein [Bacteroides sp.]
MIEERSSMDIEDMLFRYYDGALTEEDCRFVEKWIGESVENRRRAKRIQIFCLSMDMARVLPMVDVKQALTRIHRQMEQKEGYAEKENRQRFNGYKGLLIWVQRIAALLFIPMLISMFWDHSEALPDKIEEAEMIEVSTNPGMTATVELSDGTVVTLNSSSSLQYPSEFVGETREVRLKGEAFFAVAKDAKRQFLVHTPNNSRIAVYGTEFNVDAYAEDETIQTTLVSGKIGFSYLDKSTRHSLMMKPGQKAVYHACRKEVRLKEANVDVETAWKDGRLIFRDTPFEEVLRSLTKRYNVKFLIKNPALKHQSFTATFTKQRLERILEIFHISSNIQFRYLEDGNSNTERQVIEVY